jgi:hypothetical protein
VQLGLPSETSHSESITIICIKHNDSVAASSTVEDFDDCVAERSIPGQGSISKTIGQGKMLRDICPPRQESTSNLNGRHSKPQ